MNRKVALFSLYDTTNVVQFAQDLVGAGWSIIASSETVSILKDKFVPVMDIADYVGIGLDYTFPPTLHSKIEDALTEGKYDRIDLVYVIPYPISRGNDVGGRTLLALACKGNRIPVMSVEGIGAVVERLRQSECISSDFHNTLKHKVYVEVSNHFRVLAENTEPYKPLLEGENPYQVPAMFVKNSDISDKLSLYNFELISGDTPCFTNMADADCILHTMSILYTAFAKNMDKIPYICVAAKHGNPCGIGTSFSSSIEAIDKALFGNPKAIWGGEVIVNFPIDKEEAGALYKSIRRLEGYGSAYWMLDIILAPSFSPEASYLLGHRKERKLLVNSYLDSPYVASNAVIRRYVRGGYLQQPIPYYVLELPLTTCNIIDLIIAWAAAFSSFHGGNEVAIADEGKLLGIGGGPSTVMAAETAINRALTERNTLHGATFAADAFFPFTDAPEMLINAGIKYGCVPSGGKNFQQVVNLFQAHGVCVFYLPENIRGFCRH